MSAKRILIIDDAKILCVGLERVLRQEGYEVVSATDGHAGVAAAAQQPFDMVLVDLVMPEIDGIETCRQIKAFRPELPVVLMTGHVDSDLAEKEQAFQGAGGRPEHLYKPFDVPDVISLVRKVLSSQS